MRPIVPSLLLTALVATAHAAAIPGYPFVYVTGEAQATVPPDVADASFSVLAEDPKSAIAEQVVERRVSDVLKLLHAAGVSDDRIDASGITKEAVAADESGTKPVIIRGYKISRQFSVRVTDLKKWPELVTSLLELQDITDLQVTFGRSDAKSIEATLVDKAAKDARERARRLAMSFGRRAGAVMAISQSQFADIGPTFGMGPEEGGALQDVMVTGERRGPALLVPHSVELSAEVHALVKLQ